MQSLFLVTEEKQKDKWFHLNIFNFSVKHKQTNPQTHQVAVHLYWSRKSKLYGYFENYLFSTFAGEKGVYSSAVKRIDIWELLEQLGPQDPNHKFPSLRPCLSQLKNQDTQIYCEKCKHFLHVAWDEEIVCT